MNFVSFPSIEGFHNVTKFAHAFPDAIKGPIEYRGKVKLHGTNAGIRIVNGEVQAQSRTQLITPESDNAGFARWVAANKGSWSGISDNCVIFGEWCGAGIMKGTAINQIGKKIFAVFAMFDGNDDGTFELIYEPDDLQRIVGQPEDVHILPWEGESFTVEFANEASKRSTVPVLNEVVERVEKMDPWVKKVFGVDGIGEGVVYYPLNSSVEIFTNFAFKAKGEKHRVTKTKESVQVDPEVAQSIDEFVAMFVTDARMEQGLAACGGSLEMKQMGAFLKWGMTDIAKESKAELEVADLTWEQVSKSMQSAVREWFIKKNREIV